MSTNETCPAERLLTRYGFKIEHPAPLQEGDIGFGVIGALPRPAPGEAVTAEDGMISEDDVCHFYPQEGIAHATSERAQEYVLGELKDFLLASRRLGHDTWFMRAPLRVEHRQDFGTGAILHKAWLRGSTWKARPCLKRRGADFGVQGLRLLQEGTQPRDWDHWVHSSDGDEHDGPDYTIQQRDDWRGIVASGLLFIAALAGAIFAIASLFRG